MYMFIPISCIPILSIPVSSTILPFFPILSVHTFPLRLLGIFSQLCSQLKITVIVYTNITYFVWRMLQSGKATSVDSNQT